MMQSLVLHLQEDSPEETQRGRDVDSGISVLSDIGIKYIEIPW